MANIKSAQKRARQDVKRRAINLSRRSSVKTAVRKVMQAIEQGKSGQELAALFNEAQSQLSRASGKGLLHRNTVSRKVSRIAARIKQVESK